MSAFLAYSYSTCLFEKEQAKIDQQVKKNRKEFYRRFGKGTRIFIVAYFIYTLAGSNSAAYAELDPDSGKVISAVPENPGIMQPQVTPAHKVKPGVKPLTYGTKGAFVGEASAICGAAL
jgi:hypothetical protein